MRFLGTVSPARAAALFLGSVIALLVASPAAAQNALMPDQAQDLSGHRVDADVFGWNKDFTEMGAIGSDIFRYAKGKQRGEAFLLVFDVGSTIPKHNVHVLYITQADMPHDPLPIKDVRERMWGIDHQYQRMWPKRPKRKHYPGAMKYQPLWEFDEVEPGICQPAVGFVMNYNKVVRYQQHTPLKFRSNCEHLRMTDYRAYWAKKDLGAIMIRFDYGIAPREDSMRMPLSVAWHLGEEVRIKLRSDRTARAAATKELQKKIARYGKVQFIADDEARGPARVDYHEDYRYLALRIAADLGGTLGQPLRSGTIVVRAGTGSTLVEPATTEPTEPATPPAPPTTPADKKQPSSYLDDFSP